MNIGDKVRVIRSKEQGIVVGFKGNNLVDVDIDDGFIISYIKSDLTLVSDSENNLKPKQSPTITKESSRKGVFIGVSSNLVYIINNSHEDFSFRLTIGEVAEIGFINTKNFYAAASPLSQKIKLELLYKSGDLKIFTQKLNAAKLSIIEDLPILNSKGALIEVKFDILEIENPKLQNDHFEVESEIDLHIEKIGSPKNGQSELEHQISVFHKKLDEAIRFGLDEIIFIHGVGNGVLKDVIQKQLGSHKNVATFRDWHVDKFGFVGATKITIK